MQRIQSNGKKERLEYSFSLLTQRRLFDLEQRALRKAVLLN